MNFVPLQVATPWSFCWGASRLEDLAQHAAEVGYETVLFPKAYRKLAPLTLTRGPYLVEGTVRVEHDDFVVDVQNLQLLGQA